MITYQTFTWDDYNSLSWSEWATMAYSHTSPTPSSVSLDCLYTIVRNPTDQAMFYGWLPPHGRTLAAGSVALIPGELLPWLKGNMRKLRSIQQNLADGVIQILQTPTKHAWCVDDNVQIVDITSDGANYTTIATDPCWNSQPLPSP